MFFCSNNSKEKGFTLVEIALVLILLGITIGTATTIISGIIKTSEVAITKERMHNIEDAMVDFVKKHGFLPCPLKEDGSKMNSTECRGTVPADVIQTGGTVPFDKLGLTKHDVRDGWGNKISYRVDPFFTSHIPLTETALIDKACIWNWKRKVIDRAPAEDKRKYRPLDFRCFNDPRSGAADSGRDYAVSLKGHGIGIANVFPCAGDACKLSSDSIIQARPMVPYLLLSSGDPAIRQKRLPSGTTFNHSSFEQANHIKLGMQYVSGKGYVAANDPAVTEHYIPVAAQYPYVNNPINHNGDSIRYFGYLLSYKPIIQLVQEAGLDAANSSYTIGELTPTSAPASIPPSKNKSGDTGTKDLGDGGLDGGGETNEKTKIIETGGEDIKPLVVSDDDGDDDGIIADYDTSSYQRAFWLAKPYQLQQELMGYDGTSMGQALDFKYHYFNSNNTGFIPQTHVTGREVDGGIDRTTHKALKDYLDGLSFSSAYENGYGPKELPLIDTVYEGLGIPLNHHNGSLTGAPSDVFKCFIPGIGTAGPVRYNPTTGDYFCKYDETSSPCEIDDDSATCNVHAIGTKTPFSFTKRRGHKIRAFSAFALQENSKFNGLSLAFVPYMGTGDPRKAPDTENGDIYNSLVGQKDNGIGYHQMWTGRSEQEIINPHAKTATFYGHGYNSTNLNEALSEVSLERKFGVGIETPAGAPNKFRILRWSDNELNKAYPEVPSEIVFANFVDGKMQVGYDASSDFNRVYLHRHDLPLNEWQYIAKLWKNDTNLYKPCTAFKFAGDIIGSYDHTNKIASDTDGNRWGTFNPAVGGTFVPDDCGGFHNSPVHTLLPTGPLIAKPFDYTNPEISATTATYPGPRMKYDEACKTNPAAAEKHLYKGCYQSASNTWLQNTKKGAWDAELLPPCIDAECNTTLNRLAVANCQACMGAYSESIDDLRACYKDCIPVKTCVESCAPPPEKKYFHKMIIHVYANPYDPVPFERNTCHDTNYDAIAAATPDTPLIHRVKVVAWLWENKIPTTGQHDCRDGASSGCTDISDYAYIFEDDIDGVGTNLLSGDHDPVPNDGIAKIKVDGVWKKVKSSITQADLKRAKKIEGCVELPATWMNIGMTMGSSDGADTSLVESRFGVNWIPTPRNINEVIVETEP